MATTAETLRRTNEVPGTRAILRNLGLSAYKVRVVLNIIRGKTANEALDILRFSDRGPSVPIEKLLRSAIANAQENDGMDPDELFVAACFADEGVTAKRWRPRARGRAGRIRKRSCHVTIVVARLPEDRLERARAERAQQEGSRRRRVSTSRAERVRAGRKGAAAQEPATDEAAETEVSEAPIEAPETTEATTAEAAEATAEAPEAPVEDAAAEAADEAPAKAAKKTKKSDADDAQEES